MAQIPRVEVFRDQFVIQPNPVSGGMADLYHAKDAQNDMREVAVKQFRRTRMKKISSERSSGGRPAHSKN